MGLGTGELIIIFLVVMVIFGSTKLPQLGDGLGRAIKNFKRAVGGQNEIDVTPKKGELKGEGTPEADASKASADKTKLNG
jgi:sec-independent protein translocase protein TatA